MNSCFSNQKGLLAEKNTSGRTDLGNGSSTKLRKEQQIGYCNDGTKQITMPTFPVAQQSDLFTTGHGPSHCASK